MPLAFGGVGAFLTTRVPGNPIGPMLLAAIVGFAMLIGGEAWVLLGAARGAVPGDDRRGARRRWPSSRPSSSSSSASRWCSRTGTSSPALALGGRRVGVAVVVAELQPLFGQPVLMEIETLRTRSIAPSLAPLAGTARGVAALAVPLFALTVASVVLRYRRGTHRAAPAPLAVRRVERRRRRFSSRSSAGRGARPAEGVGSSPSTPIPVAIGIAILRYRLFEIDRIISRSISYAVISVVLLAAYVALVLFLQGPLGGLFGGDTVAVAASTLVVAGLFQPLRRRVQRVVDRRFDRARFDASDGHGASPTDCATRSTSAPSWPTSVTVEAVRPKRRGCGCATTVADAAGLWLTEPSALT